MKQRLANDSLKSDERYKAFIAQSTEGIWRCELEQPLLVNSPIKKQIEHFYRYGFMAECNDAMARMYGLKRAKELIGTRLEDLLIRTDEKNTQYLTNFVKSGYQLTDVESYELDARGNKRIFQNNLIGVVKNGNLLRAWGTQRDITTQKADDERRLFLERINSALVVSLDHQITLQEIAQLILTYLADYCRIAIVDDNQTIKEIAVNHTDPSKITLAEDLYKSYKDLPESTYGLPSLLRNGKSELMEVIDDALLKKYKTNEETLKIVKQIGLKSYMGVPLIARKKVIGAITFSSVQDSRYYTKKDLLFAEELARRIALTLDNIRLFKGAQEAIALRDDFISVASHELKTPITSVKIFTQVLQKHAQKNNDVLAEQSLIKMDKQIDKLTELIYNLLNISKIQSGRMEFSEKEFDFDNMVEEVVDVLQHMTTKHKLVIHGKTGKKIRGDEDRIGQVLSNLISNAVKYSPKGDTINITLSAKKNLLGISVQDFGIGMDNQHLNKIFNRFYRVSGATDKTFPGLGIGLYISNEIIKRHNGKLWAESTIGKGSTFYLTLPLAYEEKIEPPPIPRLKN